jgi:hypothetical protein
MASPSTSTDYKAGTPADRNGASEWPGAVEEFLTLLARAVRQFHTYPETSSMCTDAVATAHRAFSKLDRHDRLALRITPHEFLADEARIGAGGVIELELVRRLHKARVAELEFDTAPDPRLTRFCNLPGSEDLADTETFGELLSEHGVELIAPRMAHRPEVLTRPPSGTLDLVERYRQRRNTAIPAGPAHISRRWAVLSPGRSRKACRWSTWPCSSTIPPTSPPCSCV